jgi:Kelch motif
MLSWLRRNPVRVLLSLFVIVSVGFFVMFATGFGPDRRIRLALGLTVNVGSCEPSPESVRNPPGVTGTWEEVARMPQGSDEIRAVGVGDEVVLGTGIELVRVGSGFRSRSRMYAYDPAANRYRRLPDTPTRVDHPLVAADRRNVYLVGGYVDGVATGKAWRYSLATRRWSELPSMPTARGALGGAVIGGRLYAVGGSPPSYSDAPVQPYRTLEILDLRTGRWRTGPPMRFPRHHAGVAALDGRLYVVGGRGFTRYALPYAERFDPETGRWQTLAPLPQGAGGLAAVALGGELVAIGGGDDPEGWVTGATWAYDPETEGWRRLPNLVHARHGHGAASVGARAFVFGGAPCPGVGQSDSAERLELG